MKKIRLGIGTYSFPIGSGKLPDFRPKRCLSHLDILRHAVEQNVPVVQLADNMPLEALSSDQLDEIAEYATAHGLTIETGCRLQESSTLETYLEISRRLHATMLRCLPACEGDTPNLDKTEHILKGVLPRLAAQQLVIGIENYERYASQAIGDMLTRLDSPWIGAVLDTTNSLGRFERIDETMHHLARHTVCLHLKDYTIERKPSMSGFVISGTPLGTGMHDIPRILQKVRSEAKSDFSCIIENWIVAQSTAEETARLEREWTKQSLAYLRGIGT
ncbi:MAG: TIM barrel protein [Eubacteriales bacterium]|nr:TIM barrel protein [Eubacteriales bacterium]